MSSELDRRDAQNIISVLNESRKIADELKLKQRASNKSGVIYYPTQSDQPYDATVVVEAVPSIDANIAILNFAATFTSHTQEWPIVEFLPEVVSNDGNVLGFGVNLDVSVLEEPHLLRWEVFQSVETEEDELTFTIKALFMGTARGEFELILP